MSKSRTDPNLHQAIQFSERLIDPLGWISKADDLLIAAAFLEIEIRSMWAEIEIDKGRVTRTSMRPNVQAQYFMLIAYAMENYFKALLVQRNRESLRNRLLRALPSYLKEHDLIKLAHRVKLSLSVSEEELLTRLSRNSVWAARYPVPIGPNGIRAMQEFSDGRSYLTAYFGPTDVDRLKEFTDRLRHIVDNETEDTAIDS